MLLKGVIEETSLKQNSQDLGAMVDRYAYQITSIGYALHKVIDLEILKMLVSLKGWK